MIIIIDAFKGGMKHSSIIIIITIISFEWSWVILHDNNCIIILCIFFKGDMEHNLTPTNNNDNFNINNIL